MHVAADGFMGIYEFYYYKRIYVYKVFVLIPPVFIRIFIVHELVHV